MTSTHEFDAYLDTQPLEEPPYHEQLLIMQQFEEAHKSELKRQGAIDALHSLSLTLSLIILRDDVRGDYLFGLHDALEVVKSNLDVAKGGVL